MVLTEVPAGVWPMITGSNWRDKEHPSPPSLAPAHRAVHLMWVVAGDEEEYILADCLTVHVLVAHLWRGGEMLWAHLSTSEASHSVSQLAGMNWLTPMASITQLMSSTQRDIRRNRVLAMWGTLVCAPYPTINLAEN